MIQALFYVHFDQNQDGIIDFEEFVRGLDGLERGTLREKGEICFKLYDLFGIEILDIFTLRQLLKDNYARVIVNLDNIIKSLEGMIVENQ